MIDFVCKILELLAALIPFIVIIYKWMKNIEKNDRNNEYYNKVLKPIVTKIYMNNKNNIKVEFDKLVSINDDYIPRYLFYLRDKINNDLSAEKKFEKIIMIDYVRNYNNHQNKMNKVFDKIDRGICAICDIASALLLTLSFLTFIMMVSEYLVSNTKPRSGNIVLGVVLFILPIVMFVVNSKFYRKDEYTLNIDAMDKIIKNKEHDYDVNRSKLYMLDKLENQSCAQGARPY